MIRQAKLISLVLFFLTFTSCAAFNTGGVKNFSGNFIASEKSDIPVFFNARRLPADINFNGVNFSFNSMFVSEYKENNIIKGIIYSPIKMKTSDVFIIFPGSGEDKSAIWSAEIIAELGFRVIKINSGFNPFPKKVIKKALEMSDADSAIEFITVFMETAMRNQVLDLMRMIDFYDQTLEPPARSFHIIGISLGGITGSLLAGVDPRAESLMMILSSGSIARILMDSEMPEIKKMRKILLEKYGLNKETAYSLFKERIKRIEPLNYAARLNPRKILMVSGFLDMAGLLDTAIPLSASRETWAAYSRPQWIIFLTTGHISSFLGFAPFWIEIPHLHHLPKTLLFDGSFVRHIYKDHFIPLALEN